MSNLHTPDEVVEELGITEDGDDLDHIICCEELIAMCGADLSTSTYASRDEINDPDLCVVCRDMEANPCPKCGKW